MNMSLEEQARAQLTGRKFGANRIYRVPALPAALTVATSPSVPLTCRFRKPGIVLAMFGQVVGASNSDASYLEVRIQLGGTRDLFTDGDSGTYVPFYALFGDARNWFPLNVPALEGQDWTVTYREITGGPATVTPSLMFSVLEKE